MCVLLLCQSESSCDGWICQLPFRIASRCNYACRRRRDSIAVADVEEVLQEVDESKLPRVMKRSAWLQLYFRRLSEESHLFENRATSTSGRLAARCA